MATPLEQDSSERIHTGTSQRVIACRKRLRRNRLMREATGQAEVAGQVGASDFSGLEREACPLDTGENLSQAEQAASLSGRTLISEVDRHPSLRAR